MDRAAASSRAGSEPVHRGRRGPAVRATGLALLVSAALFASAPAPRAEERSSPGISRFEERQQTERSARSRYRRLELASLALILAAGSAAIYWIFRRK